MTDLVIGDRVSVSLGMGFTSLPRFEATGTIRGFTDKGFALVRTYAKLGPEQIDQLTLDLNSPDCTITKLPNA